MSFVTLPLSSLVELFSLRSLQYISLHFTLLYFLTLTQFEWHRFLSRIVYYVLELRLMERGVDLDQMVQTVLTVEEIKKSRRSNMRLKGWEKLNLAIDTAGKSLRQRVLRKDAEPNTIQARTA
jgi:hypothetical protein